MKKIRWHRDREVALAAVLAVMLFGVLDGLLVAIAFSVAMLLRSLASPRVAVLGRVGAHDYVSLERFPAAVTMPDMLVLRPEEPLFFANAEPVMAQVMMTSEFIGPSRWDRARPIILWL